MVSVRAGRGRPGAPFQPDAPMTTELQTGRAFVFDFGRVVFRWRPEALVAAAIPHRTTDAEAVRHWVEQVFQAYGGDWGDFDRGVVEPPELARRIAARTGLAADEAKAIIDGCPQELVPLADTVAWLHRLHAQGRPLHYLSNMPEPMAAHFERTHAFLTLFESGVFSSRVKLIKPEPAIFEHAATLFRRAPAQLLLLDDHLPNIVAARTAGWKAVHFVDAAQAEAEVLALGW
jgi:putative hydrolase of the HAD superfamily